MKYVECNKIVKKLAFERAISSDVPEKSLTEMYADLEAIGLYSFEYFFIFNSK